MQSPPQPPVHQLLALLTTPQQEQLVSARGIGREDLTLSEPRVLFTQILSAAPVAVAPTARLQLVRRTQAMLADSLGTTYPLEARLSSSPTTISLAEGAMEVRWLSKILKLPLSKIPIAPDELIKAPTMTGRFPINAVPVPLQPRVDAWLRAQQRDRDYAEKYLTPQEPGFSKNGPPPPPKRLTDPPPPPARDILPIHFYPSRLVLTASYEVGILLPVANGAIR